MSRVIRSLSCATLIALSLALPLQAQPTTSPAEPQRRRITFTEASPVSGLQEYCRRTRQSAAAFQREGTDHEYKLADESFELFVPEAARPDNPHGLLVWISPGRSNLPRDWFEVLERHKLIWICPNNAGNGRHFLVRIGLALDAVHNAKASLPIDPKRVYVAGFSGGGRVSSIVALTYPDVVTGAIPMMGCNFYRNLPAGDGKYFRGGASKPIEPIFAKTKSLPMVLVTGETDANRPQTKANFEAFQKDRFRNVSYIEVPGIGHDMPEAKWFDKALSDLDVAAATTRPSTTPARRGRSPSS